MKRRLVSPSLAMHLQGPVRFGRRWRDYESPLRIGQLVLGGWLAVTGAKLIAHAVAQGGLVLAGLLH